MFLPIVGLFIFVIICALLFILGIFVLTYLQSKWGLGKRSWNFMLFVIGGLAGGGGTAVAITSLDGHSFYGIVNRFYATFGPNITKTAIVLTFSLAVTLGGTLCGIFAVWLVDRLIP